MKATGSALVFAGALLSVSACGKADDPAQGGVSAREAEALNDAAAMLDDDAVNTAVEGTVETNAAAPTQSAGNVE